MIKIFKPFDFHVHLREGDLAKYVLAENSKHFQKILIMPNLQVPITNSYLLHKYRNHLPKNKKNLEILFTIYLNKNCSIKELSEMKKMKLIF